MKKMALVLAGILAAGSVYAADTTSGAIVTNLKGKLEWKSTVLKTTSTNKKDVNESGTAKFLEVDNDTAGYEPMSEATFSGTLFKSVNAELGLKASEDNKYGDLDSSYLKLSKTIGDTYVEWNSDIKFDQNTLFKALTKSAQLTVKKTMKETEGQIKAKIDSTEKFGVDTTSADNYIKYTPGAGALSLTFRPYDIDWTVGDEFENKNFDVEAYADCSGFFDGVDGNVNLSTNSDAFKFFDDYKPADATTDKNQLGGLEVEYKLGTTGKVFGAFSGNIVDSSKSKDKDKKDDTFSGRTYFAKVGAELTPAGATKIVPTLLLSVDSKKEKNENTGAEVDEAKNGTLYLGLNVDAETTVGAMKLEGEFDYRSYKNSYEDKKGSENKYEGGASQLGLFAKVSQDMSGVTPYVSGKLVVTGIDSTYEYKNMPASENKTINEGSKRNIELTVGADKKIEALTLNAEATLGLAKTKLKRADDLDSKYELDETTFGLGVKATYEF